MKSETEATPETGLDPSLTYAEAIAQLETILNEIDGATVDVDALSAGVERAAALLKFCRRKITGAETRIVDVLEGIEEEEPCVEEQSND